MVTFYEKHIFSGLYIYKLVLPESANSQNGENKRFLHGFCSPPTGKTVLLQAVQIHFHKLASSAWCDRRYLRRERSSQR